MLKSIIEGIQLHISYFKASDNPRGYLQIVASVNDKEELLSLGFSTTLKKPEPKATITQDPDKGDGEVGSLRWHANAINSMEDKRVIEKYVINLCDINIDLRGKLETVKAKAISAVESWKQQEL